MTRLDLYNVYRISQSVWQYLVSRSNRYVTNRESRKGGGGRWEKMCRFKFNKKRRKNFSHWVIYIQSDTDNGPFTEKLAPSSNQLVKLFHQRLYPHLFVQNQLQNFFIPLNNGVQYNFVAAIFAKYCMRFILSGKLNRIRSMDSLVSTTYMIQ